MPQFGGKNAKKTKKTSSSSKRHFTVVMGGKEHGLYVSSTPSSAARKAVTKLCTANKSKEVEFYMREITQDSKKKTYGPYLGYIEKLKEPIELKGRVIKYKPVAKLSGKKVAKSAVKKGGMRGGELKCVFSEMTSETINDGKDFSLCCNLLRNGEQIRNICRTVNHPGTPLASEESKIKKNLKNIIEGVIDREYNDNGQLL
jgi:hypothetical protein